MKIGLIGFYYNIGSFESMTNGFTKNGAKVDFFPLMYYMDHDKKNLREHFESFLNGKSLNDKIICSEGKIDALVWKYYNIPTDVLRDMTAKYSIPNIMYNWNDPEITSDSAIEHNKIDLFVKYMDLVFTTSKLSIPFYKKHGVKNIEHITAAYDPNHHHAVRDPKYIYDVTFIINNLYEGNELGIDRKKLIDDIISIENIRFGLFGVPQLKNHYEKYYVSELSNDKISEIINKSKININTHHTQSNGGSLNERAYQILASGGLMLMDHCSEFDEHIKCGEDYIRLDILNVKKQIIDILNQYTSFTSYKISGHNKIKGYTWQTVTNTIIKSFNKIFGKKLNNTNEKVTALEVKYNGREILDRYTIENELFPLFRLINEFGPDELLLFQLKVCGDNLTDINFYLNNYFNTFKA